MENYASLDYKKKYATPIEKLINIATYIVAMESTTIQISKNLLERLKERKVSDKESYEEVIWDLIEDTMELSEETKNRVEEARKEIAEGKVYSMSEVKKELGL